METGSFILRPTADVSVEHQKSSGDYAWKLLNEEVADGDTGYIYARTKGSTGSSRVRVTTVCQAGGTSPINYFYIRGLSIHYNAQHDGTKQSDDEQFNQGWVINRSTGKHFNRRINIYIIIHGQIIQQISLQHKSMLLINYFLHQILAKRLILLFIQMAASRLAAHCAITI